MVPDTTMPVGASRSPRRWPLSLVAALAITISAALSVPFAGGAADTTTAVASQGMRADVEATLAVSAVDAIGTTVGDLDRAVAFYRDVLGFRETERREVHGREWELLSGVFGARSRVARMTLGDEAIELTEFLAPRGRAYPADTRANDHWFQHIAIVVGDIDAAYARLRERGVAHASPSPQRLPDWNPTARGIQAFYFRDPDGHFLELIQFPAGVGDARWHAAGAGLFRGIDHTAIVVDDTDEALRFYRDQLGLRIAGGSENYGVEQEHLNNVFGARLRITTLRAGRGPGVELLEYLAPGTGRPAPRDLAANDLGHWHTQLHARDLSQLFRVRLGGSFVSPMVVALDDHALAFTRGALVRDPDHHGVRLVEP